MHLAGPRSAAAEQAGPPEARLAALLDVLPEAERIAAEEAVGELVAARTAALGELDQLAHVVSHDLTEPLRMVSSFLELLERRAGSRLDDRSREFVAYAAGGAAHLRGLLDDLLRYSRLAGIGETAGASAPTDAGAALGTACEALAPDIARTGATIRVDGELGWLRVDPAALGTLLTELVANALEFAHPDRPPVITVAAARQAREDGLRALTVADDGIGIAPAHHDRVWAVFTRLHGRDEHPGNGIGLALVRRIAELHGGHAALSSDGDRGTVVELLLPDGADRRPA